MSQPAQIIDLNIHHVVAIRLVNPTQATIEALHRQLGPALVPPTGSEPDILITFQKQLAPSSLNYIGANVAAFTSQAFYLLDKANGKVKAQISFTTIGNKCEIWCEPDITSIPLFFDLINFAFLRRGYVPVHASAVIYKQIGILLMGWPKGGKTGAMLSLINQGAQYVGDEWILLSRDGQKMLGLPVPVGISDWQLPYVSHRIPKINWQQQLMFKGVHTLAALQKFLARGHWRKSFPAKMLHKAVPVFKRQLKVTKSPQTIFKGQIGDLVGTPHKLFLLMSHDQPDIKVEPFDPQAVALQMVQANMYEQKEFFDYYRAFKFAFPHLKSDFLENITAYQRALLCEAFAGKEAYRILHPYGGPLDALFEKIRPFCL